MGIHECNYAKLKNYDKNRKICIKEYAEFLTEKDEFEFVYHKEWEELSEKLSDIIKELIDKKLGIRLGNYLRHIIIIK